MAQVPEWKFHYVSDVKGFWWNKRTKQKTWKRPAVIKLLQNTDPELLSAMENYFLTLRGPSPSPSPSLRSDDLVPGPGEDDNVAPPLSPMSPAERLTEEGMRKASARHKERMAALSASFDFSQEKGTFVVRASASSSASSRRSSAEFSAIDREKFLQETKERIRNRLLVDDSLNAEEDPSNDMQPHPALNAARIEAERWRRIKTTGGRVYWHNKSSGETRWELPPALVPLSARELDLLVPIRIKNRRREE
mmetsp:Transcript_2199/g.5076  ORF Transcript_2199/g.5076 Transcript_2199/m.5076 type:complete len:250 (-) Transcript_2199:182-931(-)